MSPSNQSLPTRQRVLLDRIIANDDLQIRFRTCPATVDRYRKAMDAGNSFPAPLVAAIGESEGLFLIDGFHRLLAMRGSFRPPNEVEADVVKVRTMDEARWLAVHANLHHGLQLRRRELRAAFQIYVRAKQHRKGSVGFKSYREIAADLGRPVSTIHRWMEADFPRVFQEMGGFGSENAKGGLDHPEETLEEAMAKHIAQALTEAATAIPAMKSQARRHIRLAASRLIESIDTANLLDGAKKEEGKTPF